MENYQKLLKKLKIGRYTFGKRIFCIYCVEMHAKFHHSTICQSENIEGGGGGGWLESKIARHI